MEIHDAKQEELLIIQMRDDSSCLLSPLPLLQVERSSEDSGSRADSSSDVFCDAMKEGPLQFKQLSADKSKVRGVRWGATEPRQEVT